jgi:hypothetical protein
MEKDIRFNRERMLLGAAFYGNYGITPQSAQIRIEAELVNGKGVYSFDIKKKGSDKSASEKTITDTDLFVARAIGMALMVEADAAPGTAPLLSYPLIDGLHLPSGIKGFTDGHAHALYNGIITMKTDQTVNLSGFPTSNFLCVPVTQPLAVLDSTNAVKSAGIQPQFKIDDVLYELPELLMLAGNHQTEIKLEAPVNSDVTLSVPANYTGKVVFLVEGWLFAGGAQQQFKKSENPLAAAI